MTHQTVLQCVVFQLDVALEQVDTQRNGLVFIYNMTNSKYSNFDYELSQKMLTLLKGELSSLLLIFNNLTPDSVPPVVAP